MKLKPYPEYKDSGVAWLGKVPKHWEVRRNKHLLNEVSNRSEDGTEELLTVSHYTGITKRRDRIVDDTDLLTTAKSLVGYKKVEKNNLVMNIMLAWNGSLGISSFSGIVSPAYCVFEINQDALSPKYLHYLHRSPLYTGIFKTASTGVIDSRLRLYPEKYFSLMSCFPPTQEQLAIARFLDYKTAQIARFIKAKKRMIELLKEQKQVIINDAVRGKIDVATGKPYRKYKDSGVEWLGQVPDGWEIRRLKDIFSNMNTKRIPLSGVQRGMMKTHEYNYYGASGIIDKVDDYIFDDDLLLIAEDGANLVLRNLPLAIIARGKFWVNNHAHILKPKIGSIEFYAHLLESINYLPWISGAAQPKLTQDRLMAIRVSVPSEKEQLFILKWIKNNTQSLDLTISRTEREIGLIQEYRTRLISDVVTGKIDVRDIKIPDIADIDDTIDESIDEPEGEEELETAEGEE